MWASVYQVILLIIIVLTALISLMTDENKKMSEHALVLFVASLSSFILVQLVL